MELLFQVLLQFGDSRKVFLEGGGGWGICTLLTSDNVPGVGHLNRTNDLSSNPPPMPGLPPQQLNIDRCITCTKSIVRGTFAPLFDCAKTALVPISARLKSEKRTFAGVGISFMDFCCERVTENYAKKEQG